MLDRGHNIFTSFSSRALSVHTPSVEEDIDRGVAVQGYNYVSIRKFMTLHNNSSMGRPDRGVKFYLCSYIIMRPNQLIFLFLIIKKIKFNEGMLYKNKNNQIM